MKLEIQNLSCGYGSKDVIKGISLSARSGEIFCILGPNGVGKTTLFKTILGFLKLRAGEILLDGENILKWSPKKLAQNIAYVPQVHMPPFPFSVLDVVVMGRTAHIGSFASPTKQDIQIAINALETLDLLFLKDRIYTEISGGERQMVLIARALAQQPQILIMDEPTSSLDFGNQIKVLEQVNRLAKSGLCIIMTSHFPDHAFICSATVALLEKDGTFKVGIFDEIVTEENMRNTYGIKVKILSGTDENGNTIRACVPLMA